MTHNPRLVRRIFTATSASASVALILSAYCIGATLAQTPSAEPSVAPTTEPNVIPAPFDPIATSSQAYSPTATPTNPGANPHQETLNTLRARMAELQNMLSRTPTTMQEQTEQQSAAVELSSIQAQIQRLELDAAQFGQYADYRRMRDQQAGVVPQSGGVAQGAIAGVGVAPSAYASPFAQRSASNELVGAEPIALSEGEAALLREQKEALNQRFHQLQQALRSLMPGDEGLAENLKKEQDVVLEQLRDINQRLANAPAAAPNPIVSTPTPFQIPAANQLPNLANATLPETELSVKTQKVNQAIQLLREAGLAQLAAHAANEIPRMAAPNYVETQLVPGAWAEGSGLAEERYNPFQQISAKDVEGINNSIDELKKRVDSLAETLANVETQLKLLTRQQVSGYVPAAQPTTQPAAQPVPETTEAPLDAETTAPVAPVAE